MYLWIQVHVCMYVHRYIMFYIHINIYRKRYYLHHYCYSFIFHCKIIFVLLPKFVFKASYILVCIFKILGQILNLLNKKQCERISGRVRQRERERERMRKREREQRNNNKSTNYSELNAKLHVFTC